ncbi:Mitotic spindle assembly checkpoint protein MAD2B [Frankliniella fusca]|uniref:Mitotic spindle assembly checkpoint protein MAD2B n=1 Tax=Frankliniella fusca TaxID=407009 RepID=A0AAE1I1J7_9NEOP|nr:Mitotic spindle assembly checkpoint protein MAD2B [Frankliniella fusca]
MKVLCRRNVKFFFCQTDVSFSFLMSQVRSLGVVDILVEFLEVSIHQLLFLRNLYPPTIFVLRKMYNIPVQVSKHPGLNQYITESLRSARELLKNSNLKSLSVCFYNENDMPIERFVFDILSIQKNLMIDQHDFSDTCLMKLRDGFRAFCLKVAAADMKPLSENSSFQIHLQTTEQGAQALASDPSFENFPWIELEAIEKDIPNPHLAPLRTIESDFLKIQMYREIMSSTVDAQLL